MPPSKQHTFDYLVIGSGAAGLLLALKLADAGRVGLINKGDFSDSNTYRAQGGIAGVMDAADSFEAHIADTIDAGAGLCHDDVVRTVINRGGDVIRELIELGAIFDTEAGQLHLTREGGHSRRRVAHAKDATGRAIGEALRAQVADHPRIHCLRRHMAIDLITEHHLGWHGRKTDRCLGAYVMTPDGEVITIAAAHTILAAGGTGKIYMFTSNPHGATGDGIAMAWRAGAAVMNLEFMQFHPTCLYHLEEGSLLLTEALRGEGAQLVDGSGRRFVFDYDERGELAPRDIVARAIDHEMKKTGADHMYLDARPLGVEKIETHFPNVLQSLLPLGIDMRESPVPIVPAAHYMCGGVRSDLAGRTNIERLHVIGESACTGLHGANRLASNSLLECLVMADFCAETLANAEKDPCESLPLWDASGTVPEYDRVQIKQNWDDIRSVMSSYVGIVRSDKRLRMARRRVALIREEIASYYWQHPVGRDLIELRNLALVADLAIRSAQQRKESRGLHYSTDYPDMLPEARDTILTPGDLP